MARKREATAITGLLAETPVRPVQRPRTAPVAVPAPEPTPALQTAAQGENDKKSDTVRSTLDLPHARHAELLTLAATTGVELGWPVRPQHVLRALVEQLLDDPATAEQVRERVRQAGRPVRRRNS